MSPFVCILCQQCLPLSSLSTDCQRCFVCTPCVHASIRQQAHALHAAPARRSCEYAKGEAVLYSTRDQGLMHATVVEVDRSVQPPQYGIVLTAERNGGGSSGDGGSSIRFTVTERLRAIPDAISTQCHAESIALPCCRVPVVVSQLQLMCPEAWRVWSDALDAKWLIAHGAIECPCNGCGALIVRDEAAGPHSMDKEGLEGEAHHKLKHRYRCAMCRHTFCDACRASPYHEGLSCTDHSRPDCMYCQAKVRHQDAGPDSEEGMSSVAGLRQALDRLGVDASWCIEKEEMKALLSRFGPNVCHSPACVHKLRSACTRRLTCGHWCCGLRGEPACPPCIHCNSHEPAVDACCQLCLAPLTLAPAVQLSCRPHHMIHLECGISRLHAGYPGPEISFGHLFCPVCRAEEGTRGNLQVATGSVHMTHPALDTLDLDRTLQLRTAVVALAKSQLKADGLLVSELDLQPGGRYDGRPADFALARYSFYQCHLCGKPYYGGARACGVAGSFKREELVCGSCSVAVGEAGAHCPTHGNTFIEWKCRYCCQPAVFFCFGTTHMCSACHEDSGARKDHELRVYGRLPACNPAQCGLPVQPHPPHGQEFCLGCGMCRRVAEGGGRRPV